MAPAAKMAVTKWRNAMKSKSVKNTSNAKEASREGRMSTKNRKAKLAAAKKSQNKPMRESPTCARNFWVLRLEPMERLLLGSNLCPGVMIMRNHGPGEIAVDTYGTPNLTFPPGSVRLVRTYEYVELESIDDKWAAIEFEFAPTAK
jgi:hypothetical protein